MEDLDEEGEAFEGKCDGREGGEVMSNEDGDGNGTCALCSLN